MTWSFKNIDALSFYFENCHVPQKSMTWKLPRITYFLPCILNLMAEQKYAESPTEYALRTKYACVQSSLKVREKVRIYHHSTQTEDLTM